MSNGAVPIVQIKRNGGVTKLQLKFGFAQFASFRITLWDTNGQNGNDIALGTNVPGEPDQFTIGTSASDLNDRYITWQASIVSPPGGAGQQYSQIATFLQDGVNCPTGPFTQTGPFTNSTATFANARFKVVD